MQSTAILSGSDEAVVAVSEGNESAVSWAAILAGAFAAAALSLLLVALGAGFGLVSVSPWSNGATLTTIGVGAGIWLLVVQWLSAALGGYLTGRLRTGWTGTHRDEVFFRDTAHGLVMWAVAIVVSTALLTSAVSALVGGLARAGGAVAEGAAKTAAPMLGGDPAYFVDSLFRSDHPAPDANSLTTGAEAGRIFAAGLAKGELPAPDKTYLATLVAARTGLSPADAEKRVTDVFAQAKSAADAAATKAREAADAARKSGIYLAFFTFLSWIVGAFIACVAAAFGGSQRDEFEETLRAV